MKTTIYSAVAALLLVSFAALAAPPTGNVDAMRGNTPLADEPRPPALPTVENKDIRRTRAYSMQPPTIPHKIEGYQIDKNANRCLFCHNRNRVEETQAIPLSVTHYMDRDGNVLATISPRRYVCTTCHVEQTENKPLVANTFRDVDTVIQDAAKTKAQRKPQ
ncbi:MAG TPA: nitrate reductase cytochrome c-type subunit [Burkholderiales bacterium]|nr:nitrate reductase cytochrome c-type subunit [Burkholderiales bacterium]